MTSQKMMKLIKLKTKIISLKMKEINKASNHNSASIKKKKYTPKTAGNKAFRLHNNMKFMRTTEQKIFGKLNKQ